MTWEIRYRSSVEKDISRLAPEIRRVILESLTALNLEAFPAGFRKLKGQKNRFRIKAARDYRVVYTVFREQRVIIVEFVGHRKDAYRWF